ncbi:hypothetical protein Tco_1006923 [Tanacetum coccineum]|uniref:Uncharacterized protein n=1 Tax=Tanacetum coccineum TaxID=301880 RepID=A0ABQ5FKA5_9ASTR
MSKKVGTPRYLSLVVPLKKVSDEVVHKELGNRMERAATNASSLEAEQDNGIGSGSGTRCQDTILGDVDAQTRFETTSTQSIDPPRTKLCEMVRKRKERNYELKNRKRVTAAELLTIVRHNLVLPVQVNAVEGDFINTSIQGLI